LVALNPFAIGVVRRTEHERGSGRLLDVLVTRYFENAELRAYWDRSFSPSNQGGRQQRQTIGADGEWRFWPRWTALWSFAYRLQDQEANFDTRVVALDVYETEASVVYELTREFKLQVQYRFRRQVTPDNGISADSNEVLMALAYSGDPLDLVR
jgi:hypothetical protein